MYAKIFMSEKFMFWGTDKNNLTLSLPYPSKGAFESAQTASAQESAGGDIVGQVVGRRRCKQNMIWSTMDCEKWWEINSWIENNIRKSRSFSFYCKYFNFNLGKWITHACYLGNITCTPFDNHSEQDSDEFGMPKYLRNCSVDMIDCGIVENEE